MMNKVLVGLGGFVLGVAVGSYVATKVCEHNIENQVDELLKNKTSNIKKDVNNEDDVEESSDESTPREKSTGICSRIKEKCSGTISRIKKYWTEPDKSYKEQYEDIIQECGYSNQEPESYDLEGTRWTEDSPRGYVVKEEVEGPTEFFEECKKDPGYNEDLFVKEERQEKPEILNPAELSIDPSMIPCWLVFPGGEVCDEDSGNEICNPKLLLGEDIMDEILYNDDAMATGLYVYLPHYNMTVYLFYYDDKPYRKWLEDHPELRR